MSSGWPGQKPLGTWQQQQHYQAAAESSQPARPSTMYNNTAHAQPRPPPLPPDTGDGRLRCVDELPACFRAVFPFRYFNAIQNDCWPTIYESSWNVVIAAPTGGGKTVLLELAILRMLSQHINASGQFGHKPGILKAVYLAPTRALVQEKVRDWNQRFATLGITCAELTGDSGHAGLEALDAADLICATPEKFDSATRSGMRFFADIGLVLIDEVHLLNESRGSSLEGVVARIKMVSRLREMRGQPISGVRYVAVSATIPNIRDLAEWLGAPPTGIKCFGEEMRPVKLRTVVRGYNPTKTDFLFERRLNDFIYQIVVEHSGGKPSLIFCSSRKGTSETATHLAREAGKHTVGRGCGGSGAFVRDAPQAARLAAAARVLKNGHLRDCMLLGIGFHHAAMDPEERAAVEALFIAQDLPVLCTTSTLALGVNLPARLVVIKGTRRYVGSEAEDANGYQEYERSTCLQMVGRAGRPQYDTEGVAVIMTQKPHVHRYEQLTNGSEVVESQLKEVLPELLNAEIVLRTIGDVSQAIEWVRATYMYVRLQRSPAAYGVPPQPSSEALDRWLRDRLVLGTVRELAHYGLVRLQDDGFGLEPLQPGVIMAERYIRMKTMVSLVSMPQGAAIPDLIGVLARSAELANIKLRRSEKKVLNEVNHSHRVRYPIMNPAKPTKVLERIATAADKIHILVNEGLADVPTDKLDYSLKQDVEQVVAAGKRIAGAMIKLFEHAGRASETFNALLLAKSLRQRLWTDSQMETRQLPGIGPLIAQRLATAGVHTLRQLAAVEPRHVESLAQRHYPFGNEVHATLSACLPPTINLRCLPVAWLPGGLVELEITVERVGSSTASSPARLLVGSLHDDALLLCRSLALEQFPSPLVLRTRTQSAIKGAGAAVQVVTSIVHERLVGGDVAVRTLVPPGVRLQGQPCHSPPKQAAADGLEAAGEVPPLVRELGSGDGGPAEADVPEPAVPPAGPPVAPAQRAAREPRRPGRGRSGRAAEVSSCKQLVTLQRAPATVAFGCQFSAVNALVLHPALQSDAAAGRQARVPVPTPPPAAADTGPGRKWRSFLTPPQQKQQQQQQGGPLQQLSLLTTLQCSVAASKTSQQPLLGGWRQQKLCTPLVSASLSATAAAPAPPLPAAPLLSAAAAAGPASGFKTCLPPSHPATTGQPGALFSQFVFRGDNSRGPAGTFKPPLLRAGAASASVQQPPGLLGSLPLAAMGQHNLPGAAAGGKEEGDVNRRKLAASLPSTAVTVNASVLNLPKLNWLTGKFGAGANSTAAAVEGTAAPPAAQGEAPLPDFASLFGFL